MGFWPKKKHFFFFFFFWGGGSRVRWNLSQILFRAQRGRRPSFSGKCAEGTRASAERSGIERQTEGKKMRTRPPPPKSDTILYADSVNFYIFRNLNPNLHFSQFFGKFWKFSLIRDRHKSVSRWGNFLGYLLYFCR